MELYITNGNIIRQTELNEELVEVELEFLGMREEDALPTSLAAFYLAFVRRLPTQFVLSSPTKQKAVLLCRDFDDRARRTLIDAVLTAREQAGLLLANAEIYFRTGEKTGIVQTHESEVLIPYQKAAFTGREFVEAFARDVEGD